VVAGVAVGAVDRQRVVSKHVAGVSAERDLVGSILGLTVIRNALRESQSVGAVRRTPRWCESRSNADSRSRRRPRAPRTAASFGVIMKYVLWGGVGG
jgi:hypothetical protein